MTSTPSSSIRKLRLLPIVDDEVCPSVDQLFDAPECCALRAAARYDRFVVGSRGRQHPYAGYVIYIRAGGENLSRQSVLGEMLFRWLAFALCFISFRADASRPFSVVGHVASSTPTVARQWVERQIAESNNVFAPAGVSFRIERWRELPISFSTVDNIRERIKLRRHFISRVINVFVVDEILDPHPSKSTVRAARWQGFKPSGQLAGAHIRAPGRVPATFILICHDTGTLSLAHELGHFFWVGHHRDPKNIMSYGLNRDRFDNRQLKTFRRFARRYRRRHMVRVLTSTKTAPKP